MNGAEYANEVRLLIVVSGPKTRCYALTGRSRLPGGEPRKASQRNTRRSVTPANAVHVWRASMPVLWKGRAGVFRRDVGDGEHAEVVIEERVYRVRIGELQ